MLQKNWFQHSKMRIIVQEQLTVGRKKPHDFIWKFMCCSRGSGAWWMEFQLAGERRKIKFNQKKTGKKNFNIVDRTWNDCEKADKGILNRLSIRGKRATQ